MDPILYPLLANFRGMSQTNFWKTHPIVNFRIVGHESCRMTQADFWKTHPRQHLVEKWAWNRPIYGIIIKIWVSFPEIGPAHATETNILKKMLEEFSRNRSGSRPGKLKFRENFQMSFQGYANKRYDSYHMRIKNLLRLWVD